jgi:hypothetical protein
LEQVKMMKFSYSPNLQEAITSVSEKMDRADVAIFPSGGNIIPLLLTPPCSVTIPSPIPLADSEGASV